MRRAGSFPSITVFSKNPMTPHEETLLNELKEAIFAFIEDTTYAALELSYNDSEGVEEIPDLQDLIRAVENNTEVVAQKLDDLYVLGHTEIEQYRRDHEERLFRPETAKPQ